MEKVAEYYTNPRKPGSFSSAQKLQTATKVDLKTIQNYLKGKETYTKHRVSRKRFKRNKIVSTHVDFQWQGDLAEVGNLSKYNDGIRFLLVLIDIVSKYIWVRALKTKTGSEVLRAVQDVFKSSGRKPERLQTDDGKEFWYKGLQDFLKKAKVIFFTIKSDVKAAVAERVIRTLKEKIHRYLTENNTYRYIDVLDDLVASYNDTEHSSIGMPPSQVNDSNEGVVLGRLYGDSWDLKREKAKLKPGAFVRISELKGPFEKRYLGNWSEEIYIVDKVMPSSPYARYKLKDWSGQIIEGTFYEKEIQAVDINLDGFWKVEKILKTKKVGKKTMYFVKWAGHDASVNSWVNKKDMKSI